MRAKPNTAFGAASRHGVPNGKRPTGSRHRWPRCGAKTRTGKPCLAAGAGFGGRSGQARCVHHGGLSLGARADKLVFFGASSLCGALYGGFTVKQREPWCVYAIPVWIAEQLPPQALCEESYCSHLLGALRLKRRTGRPVRGLHGIWPQRIGFRPALLLLERGRVSHGVFALHADIARWTRARAPWESVAPGLVRAEASELLDAIRASGGPIKKRTERERNPVEHTPRVQSEAAE